MAYDWIVAHFLRGRRRVVRNIKSLQSLNLNYECDSGSLLLAQASRLDVQNAVLPLLVPVVVSTSRTIFNTLSVWLQRYDIEQNDQDDGLTTAVRGWILYRGDLTTLAMFNICITR